MSNINLWCPWGGCANSVTLKFKQVGALDPAKVRELWMHKHKNLGSFTGSYTVDVPRSLQLN
jgi:hypothetical protein